MTHFHCCEYRDNIYLFQTKNPEPFNDFKDRFPPNRILGTTIESNRDYELSKVPNIKRRVNGIWMMKEQGFQVMVSIEPVPDFDIEKLLNMIKTIKHGFIFIGADLKKHYLMEPLPEKIMALIHGMEEFTEVRVKSNLNRLMFGSEN
jgi:hypothetical protein